MSIDTLAGLGHIMVTPFDTAERIDEVGVRAVTSFALASGVSALIPLGIMGEVDRLVDSERDQVIDQVVGVAAGAVPIIVGCTAQSTRAVVLRIQRAADLGATAAMVAPPKTAGSEALQRLFYSSVASESPLPIVLQDEPVTTGVRMGSEIIGELTATGVVGAVKVEESPSPSKISGILENDSNARCFGGLGGLYLLEELNRGAVGTMTGFGVPEVLVGICRAYAAGDRESAREKFFKALPLIRYEAQLGVGGVAIRKQLLAQRGIIASAAVRSPSAATDSRTLSELEALLSELETQ